MNNTYEDIVNQFFSEKYNYLIECANNILKLIKRQDLVYELIGDCYLHITTNKEKLNDLIINGNIEAISIRWMTMQIKWKDTQFKKAWIYPNKHHTSRLLDDVESYAIIDNIIPEEELLAYEIETQDKLNYLYAKINNETLDQKLLFNDVFNLGINTSGKLSKHTGISRTGCYHMIKNLKDNLRNGYTESIKKKK